MVQLVLNRQWCGFSRFQTITLTCKKMATLTRRYCGFGHFQTKCCSCLKMAEILAVFQQCFHLMGFGVVSAVFQQSTVFVGKRQKFRPFSNNVSSLRIWALFRPFSYNPKCFGRFPTTVFRPFSNNGFRPFSNKFSAILQLIPTHYVLNGGSSRPSASQSLDPDLLLNLSSQNLMCTVL